MKSSFYAYLFEENVDAFIHKNFTSLDSSLICLHQSSTHVLYPFHASTAFCLFIWYSDCIANQCVQLCTNHPCTSPTQWKYHHPYHLNLQKYNNTTQKPLTSMVEKVCRFENSNVITLQIMYIDTNSIPKTCGPSSMSTTSSGG